MDFLATQRARLADFSPSKRRRFLFAALAGLVLMALAARMTMHATHRHPPPPRDTSVIVRAQPGVLDLATDDGWSKTVRYDGNTRIHKGPDKLDPSALAAGVRVHVRDQRTTDGTWLAIDIDVRPQGPPGPPPPPPPGSGAFLPTALGLLGLFAVLKLTRRATRG